MQSDHQRIIDEILEQTLAGYWDWDIPTGNEYLSPTFKRMFGYEDHEIPNRAEAWQKLIFQEDLPGVLQKFQEHVASHGRVPYCNEVRFHHKNGSTVWVLCTGKVIEWDEQGNAKRMVGCHVDMTARKEAEMRLRETTQFAVSLMSLNPDIIYIYDVVDRRTVFVNEGIGRTLGYEVAEIQAMAADVVPKLMHPDDLSRYWATTVPRYAPLADRAMITHQYRMRHRNGDWRWLETTEGIYQRNSDGSPRTIFGVAHDITERQTVEERLRSVLDATPFPVAVVDLNDDKILFWSESALRLFGHTAPTAAEWYALAYPDPKYREEVVGRWKPVMETARKSGKAVNAGEYRVTCKDGSVRVCELYAAFVADNLIVTFNDITDRKLAEQQLHMLKRSIDVLADGAYWFGVDNRIIYVNQAACSTLGYSQAELLGMSVSEVNPRATPEALVAVWELLRSKGSVVRESVHRRKDGSEFPVEVRTNFVRYGDVEICCGFAVDITARKRAEEAIANSQKLEALGILAGGIAHDFNNLLSGIFGFIDLAALDPKDPQVADYLARALQSIDRARGLTRQLLTFAKGGSPVKKVEHLQPFIKETVLFALSGSSVSKRFDLPEDLWPCEFDRNQTAQVIDNIVINALQAMPAGGFIEISAHNVELAAQAHPSLAAGRYVSVAVQDHGVGMPPDMLPRIFDPFYTTKPKGHGLGLATSYSIIKRHGGCIDVTSSPGKGSTFTFYLPAAQPEAVAQKSSIAPTHHGSGTILVMDDEPIVLHTLEKMLRSFGYDVLCAKDGSEAIGRYSCQRQAGRNLRAMIFDLTVPGAMGGKEALLEVRKLDQAVPVFVASGYANDPVIAHPDEFGFTASLSKPFRVAELAALLNKHLASVSSSY